jgi:hypothetical protein
MSTSRRNGYPSEFRRLLGEPNLGETQRQVLEVLAAATSVECGEPVGGSSGSGELSAGTQCDVHLGHRESG